MNKRSQRLTELLRLSHDLGNSRDQLAILAEGNTSTRLSADRFLVKASGSNLGSLTAQGVVECKAAVLFKMMDRGKMDDLEIEAGLMSSRVDTKSPKPSVEALFHAWLLTLPGIEFVGHTHPPSANGILCSPRAREFAVKRMFPDEIVCCDVESVFVPYTDPGLTLSRAIRAKTQAFMRKHGRPPRVILLENHGVITLGPSLEAVRAAMWMAEKAARIWLGAAVLGGPKFFSAKNVARISGRVDEALRRKLLKI
jgi:rhamnose utilization protein RhaD (predicted bifunctional aldolase and dehydrogenase)